MARAIFAGGCFWCTEAIFMRIKGVDKVNSGYIGGHIEHPSYDQICDGNTGHVEAVEIFYNERNISYEELLKIFFHTHDPTQFDGQGNDIGPQYLSRIYFINEMQKIAAQKYIEHIESDYSTPIITKLYAEKPFYIAEDYHQNYFNNNNSQPYCQLVIAPKVNKLNNFYKKLLK